MNLSANLENAYLAHDEGQHARKAFEHARTSARVNRAVLKLLGRDTLLLDPEEAKSRPNQASQPARGLQNVPIKLIVGSLGRTHDFDRSFRPLNSNSAQRWASIDKAFHAGAPLPPVQLYARDGKYYVVDGHHRISVARLHGQEYIDAEVQPLP
jgi:hypothetical protein